MALINIADLVDPDDTHQRTYRQVNREKQHQIPIGTLVEIVGVECQEGVRLYVVFHARDCDQAPLYCLSPEKEDTIQERKGFYNQTWINGYAEEYLKIV